MIFKKIGILDEERKNFLMQHVADSQELVKQFWSTPMLVYFDKQRIAHVCLMISPIDNKLHWVATLRITKKSSVRVKPVELWSKDNFQIAERMLRDFYSEVGIDDSQEPKFEKFDNAYCYLKPLSQEEINLLPKSIDDTIFDNILDADEIK